MDRLIPEHHNRSTWAMNYLHWIWFDFLAQYICMQTTKRNHFSPYSMGFLDSPLQATPKTTMPEILNEHAQWELLFFVIRIFSSFITPCIGCVCWWISSLHWQGFLRVLRFSPLLTKHQENISTQYWSVSNYLRKLKGALATILGTAIQFHPL